MLRSIVFVFALFLAAIPANAQTSELVFGESVVELSDGFAVVSPCIVETEMRGEIRTRKAFEYCLYSNERSHEALEDEFRFVGSRLGFRFSERERPLGLVAQKIKAPKNCYDRLVGLLPIVGSVFKDPDAQTPIVENAIVIRFGFDYDQSQICGMSRIDELSVFPVSMD